MSLFFDQNLSRQLPERLADVFPGSRQAMLAGLASADDATIWDFAKAHGLAIVTYDHDFVDRVARLGPPPKVIHLTTGNLSRPAVERLIRERADDIRRLLASEAARLLRLP